MIVIITVLLFASLCIASYTDVKTRTIPVWLFPSVMVIGSGILLYMEQFGYWNLIGLACMLIPTFALATTGNFGGGDVLMLSAIGLMLGEDVVGYVVVLATISTGFFLLTKLRKREYPIAPFALVSYLIFLVWKMLS
ncbi:prepilin peptidase [Blautia sp. 1033sp1_1033st1_G9_1033SCRN_220408]|uniref:prepilin peptidase n=1 Tax=Blautia sp. 1033sp1_1033st1_G9_1033SCRN_220408 TaxID=3144490 RepID=UPI0034A32151